jgi:dihydroflavonol-4-reductase
MTTLVTGGTGFLGRHLVALLRERGDEVVALVRPQTDASALEALGARVVRGDLFEEASLRAAAAGCERVFHVAGRIGYERRERAGILRANVDGVRAVLAALEPGARLIHVSSVAAVGPVERPEERATEEHPYPPFADRYVYPESKRAGERLCFEAARAGVDVVVACPGFLIGPGDVYRVSTWPVWRYLQGTLRVVVPGGLSFVDARDVAGGLVALAERGRRGERTILTSREGNLSHRAFFRRVGEIAGVRRRQVELPARWAVLGARLVPWPVKPGEVAAAANWWFFDPGKAERELGFVTRPLDETIAATVAQYQPA